MLILNTKSYTSSASRALTLMHLYVPIYFFCRAPRGDYRGLLKAVNSNTPATPYAKPILAVFSTRESICLRSDKWGRVQMSTGEFEFRLRPVRYSADICNLQLYGTGSGFSGFY